VWENGWGKWSAFNEIGKWVVTRMDRTLRMVCIFSDLCIRGGLRWTCFTRLSLLFGIFCRECRAGYVGVRGFRLHVVSRWYL
jgi:hypothetical protein